MESKEAGNGEEVPWREAEQQQVSPWGRGRAGCPLSPSPTLPHNSALVPRSSGTGNPLWLGAGLTLL